MRNPIPKRYRLTPLEIQLLHALQVVLARYVHLEDGERLVVVKPKRRKK
jgi:hypothetical protein